MSVDAFHLFGEVEAKVDKAVSNIKLVDKHLQTTQAEFKNTDKSTKTFEKGLDAAGSKASKNSSLIAGLANSVRNLNSTLNASAGAINGGGFLPMLGNLSEIVQGIPQIGQLAGALVRPMLGAAEAGVKFNAMIESAEVGFEGVVGSAEKAKQYVKELTDFAANNPIFNTEATIGAARQMATFGFETQKTTKYLKTWGSALAGATGQINPETLDRVVTAFGQMRISGKLNAGDMMQLTNANIPAWELLAKAIGKTVEQTRKLSELGKLDARASVEAITGMLAADPRFAGQADKAANTLNGRLAQAQDLREISQARAMESTTKALSDSLGAALSGDKTQMIGEMAAGIDSMLAPVAGLISASAKTMLGGGITSGLTEAFTTAKSVLPASVLEMAKDGILSPFKQFFGINSPSTVMKEQGMFLALGLHDGLQEGSKKYVQPAVDDLKKQLEELLKDPSFKAFLEVIKRSEVGKDKNPYTRLFGPLGHLQTLEGVDPMEGGAHPWPGMQVNSPTLGRKVWTHTLGPYQAEPGTYRDFSRQTGIRDVLPHSQDMFAAWDILTRHPKALEKIQGGDALGAMNALKKEWESFALNNSTTKQSLVELFEKTRTGGQMIGGSEVSTSNPLPVSITSFAQQASTSVNGLVNRGERRFQDFTKPQDLVGGAQFIVQQHASEARTVDGGSVDAGKITASLEPITDSANRISYVLAQTARSGFPELAQAAKDAFGQADKAAGEYAKDVIKSSGSISEQFKKLRDDIKSDKDQIKDFIVGIPEGVGDVFVNSVKQWDGTFKGFFKSVAQGFASMLQDLALQLIKAQITKGLSKLLGNVFGGKSSDDSDEDDSGSGGGFNIGSISGVIKNFLGGLGKHATGTADTGDQPFIAGDSLDGRPNPEIIFPRSARSVVPLSQLKGQGGGDTYNMTFVLPGVKNKRDAEEVKRQLSSSQIASMMHAQLRLARG